MIYPQGWEDLKAEVEGVGEFHSPMMLLQEAVGAPRAFPEDREWRILLASLLSMYGSRDRAHPAFWRLLARWPRATAMAAVRSPIIGQIIKPHGFKEDLANDISTMSKNWMAGLRPPEIHGSEFDYVQDAWSIFVEKETHANPSNKELRRYVIWKITGNVIDL